MAALTVGDLVLDSVTAADLPAVIMLANDLAVARQTARIPHPLDGAGAALWLAGTETPGETWWAIRHRERFAGAIGAIALPDGGPIGGYDLSYWLGRPYWGQGLASRAVIAVRDHVLSTTPAPHLHALHAYDNPASGRVLEKAGFIRGSDCLCYSRAREQDVPCYSYTLTRADWIALKANTE